MQLLEKFDIQIPVVQAPMAGASTTELALAVSGADGLGLHCLCAVDNRWYPEGIHRFSEEDFCTCQPQLFLSCGAIILSSATTLAKALWLEENGCDVIIAQGAEAGGYRAIFLEDNLSNQPGAFELLEAILSKVRVPVIAAGGIA